jgi:hypothetical protein
MIRPRSTHRLFFLLLLSFGTFLHACTFSEKTKPGEKVGMHIDTVMDFVVEYPLSWDKDRRLVYGSKDGEVLWTHPEHPGTVLLIGSHATRNPEIDTELQIAQALQKHPGLSVSTENKVKITAGEVWHITGQTLHENVDIYMLFHPERNYLISLTTPLDSADKHSDIMAEVLTSFQIMLE